MATYIITGVSRGIGYEFLRLISQEPGSTVIGIVRDKATTVEKVLQDEDLKDRTNIHIVEADVTDYAALKRSVVEVTDISGGSIDYIIANAGLVTPFGAFDPIGVLGEKPEELEYTMKNLFDVNVISNIHLFNLYLPLVRNGRTKKVIVISSCLADQEFTKNYDVTSGPLYAISKAAVNMVVAKFSAQYKKEGILFLSICPGMVNVGHYKTPTAHQLEGLKATLENFKKYAPNFTGSATPQVATRAVKAVWEMASIENGNGGEMLSRYGNKQWIGADS